MKQTKFRAWNKKHKRWMFDYKEFGGFALLGETVLVEGLREVPLIEIQDMEIMQYTGLKDKHGKEIYEGDIVKSKGLKAKVCLGQYIHYIENKKSPAFGVHFDGDEGFFFSECLLENGRVTVEIIGNIYENPDLLNN